jgi:hypothetical protein
VSASWRAELERGARALAFLASLTTEQMALAHAAGTDSEEARAAADAILETAAAWRAYDSESYDTLLAAEAVVMAEQFLAAHPGSSNG